MATSRLRITQLVGLSMVALVIGRTTNDGRSEDDKPTALKTEIERFQQKLKKDGKPEYVALLSEERVRAAIRTAVNSFEKNRMEKDEKAAPGTKAIFLKVKPAYLQIAEKGELPKDCSLSGFYTLVDDHDIRYDGLGLRLTIHTPSEKFAGFDLPILDLFYGRSEAAQ